ARLPSTRDLAHTYDVALATAAHALKTLADEGLVRPLPRVGNVVLGARPIASPKIDNGELTRERIVAAAIRLADDEGIATFSIRGVAASLGAPPMSLYRHVRGKDELVALMTDAAMGEMSFPSPVPEGWRARLDVAARLEWEGFKRHPWLARVLSITRPQPLPNGLRLADWIFASLDGHGLDVGTTMYVHVMLHSFIQGLAVNVDAENEAASQTGLSDQEWMQRNEDEFLAIARSGRFPFFANALFALPDGFDMNLDTLFELGLDAMLDGIATLIANAPKTSGKPKKALKAVSRRRDRRR
ncbi:MAG TPA: TetR/AcrR family transcriptional regulator C-terminal domain-containing protein, partial [Polyangiaceae bacterium]